MKEYGLTPTMINIGGGFPVYLTKNIPSIELIGSTISTSLNSLELNNYIAEPGRYMVSDAGILVTKVIGIASRGGKNWLHLDCGIFGGLFESMEGIRYSISTDREGSDALWNLAGPTCDSLDIIYKDIHLPGDIRPGDLLYFMNAGAYSTSYASNFNGFSLPRTEFI
jgi:ornithine decarboxylase